jgi:hypothetical protein
MKTQAERWAFEGVDRELLERIARDLRTLLLGLEERAAEVDDGSPVSR